MTVSPWRLTTETPQNLESSAREFIAYLEESIGVPFALCTVGKTDEEFETDPLPSLVTDSDLRNLVNTVAHRGYALGCCDDRHTTLLVRLPNLSAERIVAVGVVQTRQTSLLERLVVMTQKASSQQQQFDQQSDELNQCVEQLTYDMEEQTWLRGLAEQLRLCDVQVSFHTMAEELLASLRGMVRAESVALFPCETDSPDQQTIWHGTSFLNDRDWRQWLFSGVQEGTLPTARVVNGMRMNPAFQVAGVLSTLAVPLTSSNQLTGWLVAVNKKSDFVAEEMTYVCSESEFGTIEATLMEAAGTLIATHSHNVNLLSKQERLIQGMICSMSSAIEARDPYTCGHSDRVGRYARLVAEQMQLPQHDQDRIYLCGLLHDVGKIGVPDHILLKPGRLTDEEFDAIKQHPRIGYDIVKQLEEFHDLLPGILHHHESMDGSGYPDGLSGEQIPLQARILAVVDSFDAMTSSRP
ncbi:MAG: HD-GYP domain-containing protein [Planctomycetaceae bacterium]